MTCVEVPCRDVVRPCSAPSLTGRRAHVVTERLTELSAWDPHAVDRDGELAVRLRRSGDRTLRLDSPVDVHSRRGASAWLHRCTQRVEGALQTALVHTRRPRGLGPGELLGLGGALVLLVNPFFWALAALLVVGLGDSSVRARLPDFVVYATLIQLSVGNLVFAALSATEGGPGHGRRLLAAPMWWGVMSVVAWAGLLRVVARPFRPRALRT